jgi:hypothetical protein
VLTTLEQAVLHAINATGQGNGRLSDVTKVMHHVQRNKDAVNRAIRGLCAKRMLPPAGISADAVRDARARLRPILGRRTAPLSPKTVHRLLAHPDVAGSAAMVQSVQLLARHSAATARDPDRRIALPPVRCSCGCRELIRDYDPRQRHHFVNRDHYRRWKQRHPDRTPAPSGSKKAEIIDALRQRVADLGTREVERLAGCPSNIIPRYANGRWRYLAPETVEYLRRVIPEVIDPTDPRLAELVDTHAVRVEMGKRVGAVTATTWAKRTPRQRRQAGRRHGDQLRGRPNPGVAQAQRTKWDAITADPAQDAVETEHLLATLRTRTHLPSEQILRAWTRYDARIVRAGRTVTTEDIHRCAVRQASDIGVEVKVVERIIRRACGMPDHPGPLVDIDETCLVRDLRTATPNVPWPALAKTVNRRLGRTTDADTLARNYRRNRHHLRPRVRTVHARGGTAWTAQDDAYLRSHRHLPDRALGRDLQRSPQGVKWRRAMLGVSTLPDA